MRYSGNSRDYVDEGYPKSILRNWNNENQIQLPVEIRKNIDSIFLDSDGKTYFFSNDKFIDSSDPKNVQKTKERWAQVVNNIVDNNEVDAVLVKDGKSYFFSGDQYSRYSAANYSVVDEGYPRKIVNNWNNEGIKQLSGAYLERIDATFYGSDKQVYLFNGNTFISTESNAAPSAVNLKWGKVLNNIKLNNRVDATLVKGSKTWLFSGDQYYRYSGPNYTVLDEGYPKKISRWNAMESNGTLPDAFNSGISAALSAQDNTSYFFSGNQYASSKSGALPAQIKDNWARVRNNIQANNKVDAGFVAPDGKTYLFSGDQFTRYSGADYTATDEGYPKTIKGNWGNLPESFNQKIDAAFRFNDDGKDRLYLFSGNFYVRYSTANYAQIDAGYPKELDNKPNPEGNWFEPIFEANPGHQYNDRIIKTIFTDQYNNNPRINYFFNDKNGVEKLIQYEYDNKNYHWSNAILVSTLKIQPFTSVDVGFSGADGKVYLFSGNNFAELKGNYTGINTPKLVNSTWGIVRNRFQELNRVDATLRAANGYTYLFCDTQYVKYSGNITPVNANFFVDEGYPKTISSNWNAENSGIPVPATFKAEGYALLAVPAGTNYSFTEGTFISSSSQQPLAVNEVWGKVENNFEDLNKVDAAFVYNNKTYLFCGNQYTRYSADYSGYNDEGYPKKIANIATEDGINAAAQLPAGIDAIMEGTDGTLYVFAGDQYISSTDPSGSADINSRFGIVRNIIADSGMIDAADTNTAGVLYLFSGDQYVRYSAGSRTFADESYPKSISNWKKFEQGAIPSTVTQGITASFTDVDGEEYFFTESDFFTLNNPALVPINSKWGKVKNNIQESGIVDAAFMAPNGKIYLFSQDQYVQYSPDAASYVPQGYPNTEGKTVYVDEGFPKKIAGNWGELPVDYRAGIDAGFVFDGRTYFFKGTTYIRYSDPACKKIDSGFPMTIVTKMSQLPEFRPINVKTFQQFKALAKKFNNPDNSILQYLKDSKNGLDADVQRDQLSSVTEWPQEEIAALIKPGALSSVDIGDIQVLTEMNALFGLSAGMGSLPSTVKNETWDKIYSSTIDLKASATILAGQLKTVMGTAAWQGLSAELHNKMNLAKRDALLGYLIHQMEQVLDTNWIHNPRDLYEYLLIDVQMGEEAITSRIQEAMMCMQLFYQRTLMNLEDENQATMLDVRVKLKSWWIWMKNYRVWEANRKVFLYPENYIRPELRLDKSPEFKELEEALLQGDITVDAADVAYKTYLEKYSIISRLKVAGGYVYQRNLGDPNDTNPNAAALKEKKIAMFGHSNTEPKKYYYMTGEILETVDTKTQKTLQSIDWASWKEIGITIDADKVYPVFSFNRLFVFWVEVRERDQSTYSSSVGPGQKKTQYDPVIYYSFYNIKGEWTNPQKMFDIGKHVDTLPVTQSDQRKLFVDDKTLSAASYIPAKDVLNGARLYVTNPITSKYYNADEFIYISFEVRYQGDKAYEFTFEGKVKSNLEFEQGQVDPNLIDKLEKNIQFPFEKFGITPVSFNHWKGFHNDAFSAPWFNFNAAGGSFLIKPDYVPDVPVIKSDKKLYGIEWTNLPDSGFTDLSNRQHLFYRDDLAAGAIQYYRVKDGNTLSAPVPVTDVWGKRNILEWYPDGIASVAVNGDKTFIVTDGNRYISYTGPDLQYIDQASAADTLQPFSLNQILPTGATPELWHRVKEDLRDFLDTLENAFVYSGDSRLYLVAKPVDENGQAVREYTIPDLSEFWGELASLLADGSMADTLRTWTTVQSANFYTFNGNRRLYITSGNNVFVTDYIAGTNSIYSVAELTHPELMSTVYDTTPVGAVETLWAGVAQSLMEFIARLTGVGNEGGSIRFIAKKQDNSVEFTVPVAAELFTALADIIDDVNLSPIVSALTDLNAADLYINGNLKRFYVRSGSTVVIFDYSTGAWSVKSVAELTHPDVTAKVSSLAGLLPSTPAVPWRDVAEDFQEYMATVQSALVWKGKLYLLTPKTGGGVEYTTPTAVAFWSAVAETLPGVAGLQTIDSACVVTENGTSRLLLTSDSNVVAYTTGKWSLTNINAVWGLGLSKINGIIQAPDNKVYLFSGRNYAEKKNNVYTEAVLTAKWGYQPNVIAPMVDSAFMDGDGRVYLFTGDHFVRYSSVDNKVIDLGYPKNILVDLGIDEDEVRATFSADKENVEIKSIGTNTAFMQMLDKQNATTTWTEEKMYLFMDITADITRYVWKWRWRWWGNWNYRGFFRHRAWWGWWWPEYYLEVQKDLGVRKSVYLRFSRKNEEYLMDVDYPKLITGSWSNLPGDFNNMITATFEDVEGIGDASKEIFYVVRGLVEQQADGSSVTTNDYVKYSGKENFPKEVAEEIYEIIRLTSNTSEVLSQKLFMDGIDGLLSLDTQNTAELPKFVKRLDTINDLIDEGEEGKLLALRDNRRNDVVLYKPEYINDVPFGDTLDFASTNAQYYWEIFFHAPFLIAQTFNNAQKFDEGNEWYEHIFDPTEQHDPAEKSFWKFLPFHADIANVQSGDLNNLTQYSRYLNDPFDPHAIAGLRQIAYRKVIVMSYIDNLIDWGDMRFRQYTRESINEARMYYVLAYDLLGKKPELLGTKRLSDARTYKQLRASNTTLNMALVELENLPGNAVIPFLGSAISPNGSLLDPYGYFYVPENREFADYWDRVEDRLYKIRYSLNIEGVKQSLALFEPPIDVMALVRAVGSGMGLAQALANFNVAVPHYRFVFILGKARELNSRLTQFGQSLLSALEKKDAEELALLRNTHEKAIMKLTLDIKNAQLQDSEETLKSLRANLKSAKQREAHYNALISAGLSPFELSQLGLLTATQVFTNLSQQFSVMSSVLGIVPEVGAFAFHWGGITSPQWHLAFLNPSTRFQAICLSALTSSQYSAVITDGVRTGVCSSDLPSLISKA